MSAERNWAPLVLQNGQTAILARPHDGQRARGPVSAAVGLSALPRAPWSGDADRGEAYGLAARRRESSPSSARPLANDSCSSPVGLSACQGAATPAVIEASLGFLATLPALPGFGLCIAGPIIEGGIEQLPGFFGIGRRHQQLDVSHDISHQRTAHVLVLEETLDALCFERAQRAASAWAGVSKVAIGRSSSGIAARSRLKEASWIAQEALYTLRGRK